MTIQTTLQQHLPGHLRETVTDGLVRMARLCGHWHERSRQRHELSTLTPELMRDIGVDPVEALQEAKKPFWVE
jgi:uncharacterized protein YjiS (DUF1127 family)